jgi:hypothetical protein
LQVQWVVGGIQLDLAADGADALVRLRAQLSAMATAMARAEMRLVRCSVGHVLPAPTVLLTPAAPPDSTQSAMAVPAQLFRAAAEVVVLLAGASAVQINPASR